MIVVKHIKTGERFILIGTGLGMYKSSRPGALGGSLAPVEEKGAKAAVAVCDRHGNIRWVSSRLLQVVEIDGTSIENIAGEKGIGEVDAENDIEIEWLREKMGYGKDVVCFAEDKGDIWVCVCGTENSKSRTVCENCYRNKELVLKKGRWV